MKQASIGIGRDRPSALLVCNILSFIVSKMSLPSTRSNASVFQNVQTSAPQTLSLSRIDASNGVLDMCRTKYEIRGAATPEMLVFNGGVPQDCSTIDTVTLFDASGGDVLITLPVQPATKTLQVGFIKSFIHVTGAFNGVVKASNDAAVTATIVPFQSATFIYCEADTWRIMSTTDGGGAVTTQDLAKTLHTLQVNGGSVTRTALFPGSTFITGTLATLNLDTAPGPPYNPTDPPTLGETGAFGITVNTTAATPNTLNIKGGNSTAAVNGGDISVQTGLGSLNSGGIKLTTPGTVALVGTTSSGGISVLTGASTGAAGSISGDIALTTGAQTSLTGLGTGSISLSSGPSTAGASGAVTMQSGTASGSSGRVSVQSGQANGVTTSGAVRFRTGPSVVGANTGSVEIGTGDDATLTKRSGHIFLRVGNSSSAANPQSGEVVLGDPSGPAASTAVARHIVVRQNPTPAFPAFPTVSVAGQLSISGSLLAMTFLAIDSANNSDTCGMVTWGGSAGQITVTFMNAYTSPPFVVISTAVGVASLATVTTTANFKVTATSAAGSFYYMCLGGNFALVS